MTRHALSLRRIAPGLLIVAAAIVPALSFGVGSVRAAGDPPKAVYTLTNAASGNAVVVYSRSSSGALTSNGVSVATGGLGTGAGLGSQGAVILSDDSSWLFAVNAGSNTISSFAVQDQGLSLVSQVWSGGTTPISLTFRNNLLYVLNAGSLSIAGFKVGASGSLGDTPISGSVQPLNAQASSPEEIAFNPSGTALLVTEKASGQIDTFSVSRDGSASGPATLSTGAVGPYASAFDGAGHAIVVDAGIGAATSYNVTSSGALSVISSQIPDFHAAPCWIVVSPNGKYAYTANAHDGTISSFSIASDGSLTLLQAIAAGPISVPVLDMALAGNGHFLYAVDAGSIVAYSVGQGGTLTAMPAGSGLPSGQGLAAN